jgi:hypothetical protein
MQVPGHGTVSSGSGGSWSYQGDIRGYVMTFFFFISFSLRIFINNRNQFFTHSPCFLPDISLNTMF